MEPIIEQFFKTLDRYAMFSLPSGSQVVQKKCLVAVSGGPDSMALWHMLATYSQHLGIQLVAVHVNHQLRGKESDLDAVCVAECAERWKREVFIHNVPTEAMAREQKQGIEETARTLRYQYFETVQQKTGAQFLATAHHLDDQAETVLMRMVRGAGMDGLGGIPPVNQVRALKRIRPFIGIERQQILAYLKKEAIPYRMDQSNADMKYRRNFVRHQLLPQIEKDWNPAVKTILSRSAEQHRDVYNYIEAESQRWWNRAVRWQEKTVLLKGGVLKKASKFIQQELIKRVVRKLAPGSAEKYNYEHFVLTAQLLGEKPPKPKISLPDGVMAEKKGKDLVISIGATERV